MHQFITKCFGLFRSTMQFLKILSVGIILLILLYWIQNLIGHVWFWFSFLCPMLDALLDLSEKIYSGSFTFFGAVFEFKYAIAIVIMIITAIVFNILMEASHEVQRIYHNSRLIFKKAGENVFNNHLEKNVEKEEKKLNKYFITLKAKLKKKYAIEEFNVDIEGINNQINQFIITQLGIRPTDYTFSKDGDCYISEYRFENFDEIDNVLDVLFKAKNAKEQVEYAICIQIEDNPEKLNKLLSLNNYNKITMMADTAFRYTYVKSPRYQTSSTGVYQGENSEDTIAIHEFKQIL